MTIIVATTLQSDHRSAEPPLDKNRQRLLEPLKRAVKRAEERQRSFRLQSKPPIERVSNTSAIYPTDA